MPSFWSVPPSETARSVLRPAVRRVREVSPRMRMLTQGGRGPLAVFLPTYGREGAALVRIYAVAAALRAHGWRTLVLSPRLSLGQRHRLLARAAPDVLVLQGVRHDLNRPHLYPGQPIVMDLDDADFHLPHLAAPLRRAMPHLAAVIAGSDYVARWCLSAGAPAHVVWTGMPVTRAPRPAHHTRPPVVAWAQSRPMTYVREAEMVRALLARLARRHPNVRFRLYDRQSGDDPGFADWFRQTGVPVDWVPKMALPAYVRSFDDVALGLAPLSLETPFSRGKSFGKVLAYLDRHVPVIGSDAGEHGAFFTPETGVLSNDPDVWTDGCARLLRDAKARDTMGRAAGRAYRARLSIEAAARQVDIILKEIT